MEEINEKSPDYGIVSYKYYKIKLCAATSPKGCFGPSARFLRNSLMSMYEISIR